MMLLRRTAFRSVLPILFLPGLGWAGNLPPCTETSGNQPCEASPQSGSAAASELSPYRQGLALYNAERYVDARPYLEQAAEAGDNRARTLLGLFCFKGLGMAPDYRRAFDLFQLAAAAGEADAQANLGYLYEQGLGIPQNIDQARGWYRRSAAQGVEMAIARLKVIGPGTDERPVEAPVAPVAPKPDFDSSGPLTEVPEIRARLQEMDAALRAEAARQAEAERHRRLWELFNRVALGVMLMITVLQAAGDSRRNRSRAR